MSERAPNTAIEWPTLVLIAGIYAASVAIALAGDRLGLAALPVLAVIMALYASVQHEILHGHPFRHETLNDALAFPALGLFIPYGRFKATHLCHHHDPSLTDPYDDPEANYLHPDRWVTLPGWLRVLLRMNNTLAGRMALGPAIGLARFYHDDLVAMGRGERDVARAYGWHAAGLVPVAALAWIGTLPIWIYPAAAYLGLSLLKIRTFAEHRAHALPAGRSVIIEDRGPLAFLFLNNNLHAVHHAFPGVPWYALPAFYAQRRESFLRRNRAYRFRSYGALFAAHLFRAKDPVAHPLPETCRTPPQSPCNEVTEREARSLSAIRS